MLSVLETIPIKVCIHFWVVDLHVFRVLSRCIRRKTKNPHQVTVKIRKTKYLKRNPRWLQSVLRRRWNLHLTALNLSFNSVVSKYLTWQRCTSLLAQDVINIKLPGRQMTHWQGHKAWYVNHNEWRWLERRPPKALDIVYTFVIQSMAINSDPLPSVFLSLRRISQKFAKQWTVKTFSLLNDNHT